MQILTVSLNQPHMCVVCSTQGPTLFVDRDRGFAETIRLNN